MLEGNTQKKSSRLLYADICQTLLIFQKGKLLQKSYRKVTENVTEKLLSLSLNTPRTIRDFNFIGGKVRKIGLCSQTSGFIKVRGATSITTFQWLDQISGNWTIHSPVYTYHDLVRVLEIIKRFSIKN